MTKKDNKPEKTPEGWVPLRVTLDRMKVLKAVNALMSFLSTWKKDAPAKHEVIMIDFTDDGVYLQGDAYDQQMRIKVHGVNFRETLGITSAPIAVVASTFRGMIEAMGVDKFDLVCDDKGIPTLWWGKSKSKMVRYDFLPDPLQNEEDILIKEFTIMGDQFEQAWRTLRSCVDTAKDGRPQLACMYMDVQEGDKEVTWVAADGFRLGIFFSKVNDVKVPDGQTKDLLINHGLVRPMAEFFEAYKQVYVRVGSKRMSYKGATNDGILWEYVTAKPGADTFVAYQQVIPENLVSTKVDRKELALALKRTKIFAGEIKSALLTWDGDEDALHVQAQSNELGQTTTTLRVESDWKKSIRINIGFLNDALSVLDTESVALARDPNKELGPVLVQPIDESGTQFYIMPMKE